MIFLFLSFLFATEINIKVDMSKASPDMKAWIDIQGAYSLSSQLIIDGKVSEAKKSAAHGVQVMKNLENMKDSELTESDLRQAREMAIALEDFLKDGKKLEQPGDAKDFYLDVVKEKLFFKNPKGEFEGIPFKEMDKFIKNLNSPVIQNLNPQLCAPVKAHLIQN